MNITLKIEDMDNETAKWIRNESKKRGIKMENLICELIQKGVAMEGGCQHSEVYNDLDALAGTWTEAQEDEFMKTIADFGRLDEAIWR